MIKQNRILVGILALILILSIGYSLFRETIVINGTVIAKGNFDITYTCEIVTEANKTLDNDYTKGGTGKCYIEDGVIKTNSIFYKPGDKVYYRINITNSGTIPAKLVTVDSSNDYSMSNLGTPAGPGDEVHYNPDYLLMAYFISENAPNYIGDSFLEQAGLILEPKQTESIVIHHSWSDIYDKQLPEDGVVMYYNIVLGFKQITN